MNWKIKSRATATPDTSTKEILSFTGGGKISVSVESILNSEKVKRQVNGVKEIAAANQVAVVKPK